ncbi:MAG: hypothetical protein EP348_06070 [Alphaproteobacteria bacterium]|nr:MAG: hypothetical protein EP348_06070 [Alphaproteobacteria bacterium]
MRTGKIIGLILGGLVLLLLLLLGGTYAALRTEAGKDFLVRQIESAASEPGVQALELGRIRGNLFSEFTLTGLTVADKDGIWLALEDLSVSWSPLALLKDRLEIGHITAVRLSVARAPVLPPDDGKPAETGGSLPFGLSLKKLQIKEIALAAPLVGKAMTFALDMKIEGKERGALQSHLDLRETDGGASRLNGDVAFTPETGGLDVDIELAEPEGGLIARSLDLPGLPPVAAALKGKGLLTAWNGKLTAAAGDLVNAAFDIRLRGEKDIRIDLSGGGRIDPKLTPDIPVLDGSRIRAALALDWRREEENLRLTSLEVENDVLNGGAEGVIGLADETLDVNAHAKLKKAGPVNQMIAPATLEGAELEASLEGSFKQAALSASWRLKNVRYPDVAAVDTLSGQGISTLSLEDVKEIPFKAMVTGGGLAGLPAEALAALGERPEIALEGRYRIEEPLLTIKKASLRSQHLTAEIAGSFAPKSGATKLNSNATLDDLSTLAPLKGRLNLALELAGPDVTKDLKGNISLKAADFDPGDPALLKITGTSPDLNADLKLDEKTLHIENLTLALKEGGVTGAATLPQSFDQITGQLEARLANLATLSDLAGVALEGTGTLNVDISGPLDNPEARGRLEVANLAVEKSALGRLSADFTAKSLATGAEGDVTATLDKGMIPAKISTTYKLPDYEKLLLANLDVSADKNKIAGNVTIPFDRKPLTGDLALDLPRLDELAKLGGLNAAGAAKGKVKMTAEKGAQAIAADLEARALSLPDNDVALAKLDIKARASGNLADPDLDVSAKGTDLIAGQMKLASLSLDAKGRRAALNYDFHLKEDESVTAELKGKGSLAQSKEALTLKLAALEGEVAGKSLHLTKAVTATEKEEALEITPLALNFGKGRIEAGADLGREKATANLSLKNFPVDLVRLFNPDLPISGALSGKANLALAKGKPAEGSFGFEANGLRMEGADFDALPDFTAHLKGELKSERLAFNGDLEGVKATNVSLAGGVPLALSMAPFGATVNENKPVNLKIDIDSEMKGIWTLLALDTQQLSGHLKANAEVSGSIANPEIAATVRLKDGVYENLEQGSELHDIALDADMRTDRKLIVTMRAQDASEGSVKAKAHVDFEKLNDPALDLNLKLDKLLALNRDDLAVTTDGDIDIKGDLKGLDVTGKITTRDVEVNIGGALAPSIATLDVEEVNRPGATGKAATAEDESSLLKNIALNLDLSLPRRVFIRGRGLDSEWEGQFTVKGTAAPPRIEGYLSPVRGEFSFAGKSFKLQEGKIRLLGEKDVDPELSLTAKYTASNITAIVSITGTAKDPKISFSSPSGLPEDEVISQVLFGKSTGKLSALEAVQLAETMAVLSGKVGSGGGIMGFARKTLGVDVISAGTDEQTGKAEVNVGKYVTDNVYVGVEQGAESGSTRAKVEIDLTPNISVESEVGQSTDSSVGIFWNWDY